MTFPCIALGNDTATKRRTAGRCEGMRVAVGGWVGSPQLQNQPVLSDRSPPTSRASAIEMLGGTAWRLVCRRPIAMPSRLPIEPTTAAKMITTTSGAIPLAPPFVAIPTLPTENPTIAPLNPPTVDQNTSGCALPNFNNFAILIPAIPTLLSSAQRNAQQRRRDHCCARRSLQSLCNSCDTSLLLCE
ncbi:hypothetical protein ABIB00_007310 [Bradyrhizobium sp. LB14.3]